LRLHLSGRELLEPPMRGTGLSGDQQGLPGRVVMREVDDRHKDTTRDSKMILEGVK
jgi:hypothetical protein